MRNYNEMAEAVFRRRDEYVAEVRRKKRIALNVSLSLCAVCLATVGAIGIWKSGVIAPDPNIIGTRPNIITQATTSVPGSFEEAISSEKATNNRVQDSTSQSDIGNSHNNVVVPPVTDPIENSESIETKPQGGTVDKPIGPVVKPTLPSFLPDLPIIKPTVPSVKPNNPVVKPTVPSVKPNNPVVKPTIPSVKPNNPVVKPTIPSVKPNNPVVKPTVPSVKPNNPVVKPTIPSVKPNEPIVKPTTLPSYIPEATTNSPTIPDSPSYYPTYAPELDPDPTEEIPETTTSPIFSGSDEVTEPCETEPCETEPCETIVCETTAICETTAGLIEDPGNNGNDVTEPETESPWVTTEIKGRVVDQYGKPVAKSVIIIRMKNDWRTSYSAITDINGNYVIKGRFSVHVSYIISQSSAPSGYLRSSKNFEFKALRDTTELYYNITCTKK